MKKKIIIFFLSIILMIFVVIFFKKNIGHFLQVNLPYKISQTLYLFYDFNKSQNRLANDYNVKFLPNTALIKLESKKISIKKSLTYDNSSFHLNTDYKYRSFYMEKYADNLLILNSDRSLYFKPINDLNKNNELNKISHNFEKKINPLDIFLFNENIYISGSIKNEKKPNCNLLILLTAQINFDYIQFKKIFAADECAKIVRGGRIQKINNNLKKKEVLLSTFADPFTSNLLEKDSKPQDDKSIYGKILKIDEKNSKFEIFSKGHRNIQGLINLDDNIILATEHGPNGRDEINRIQKDKNYGWDVVSYGTKYFKDEGYSTDHKIFGFEEPIYAFIPSIGIAEIIFLGEHFTEEWKDDFIIGSLNSRSIYRVKFNDLFDKIIYIEKIFIGERIRDMLFDKTNKQIILSLEDSGSILTLKKKQ